MGTVWAAGGLPSERALHLQGPFNSICLQVFNREINFQGEMVFIFFKEACLLWQGIVTVYKIRELKNRPQTNIYLKSVGKICTVYKNKVKLFPGWP